MKIWTVIIFPLILFGTACGGSEEDYTSRMANEHEGDEPASNVMPDYLQESGLSSGEVTYMEKDGVSATGYYAEPENAGSNTPALVVIHEWWGLNDNIRAITNRFSTEGYKALAVDLYSGEISETPEHSMQLMEEVMGNREAAIENLNAAIEYLRNERTADKLGVIGWCFGGAWSLNLSLASADEIDATVIYYGQLETDPQVLSVLNHPVLGIFGEEDQGIPVESVREFESALQEAGVEHEIHVYEGADHAFANPSGNRYNARASEDAWEKTLDFLERTLKQ